jgi:hypothetical protein
MLQEDGTWIVNAQQGWRCFSKVDWYYPDLETAKQAFREQIALHIRCSGMLSEQRCVALSEERGNWRLWQIVQTENNLENHLQEVWDNTVPEVVVDAVLLSAQHLLNIYQLSKQYPFLFQLNLANIGIDNDEKSVYYGMLENIPLETSEQILSEEQILTRHLLPNIHNALQQHYIPVGSIVETLDEYSASSHALLATQLTKLFVTAL